MGEETRARVALVSWRCGRKGHVIIMRSLQTPNASRTSNVQEILDCEKVKQRAVSSYLRCAMTFATGRRLSQSRYGINQIRKKERKKNFFHQYIRWAPKTYPKRKKCLSHITPIPLVSYHKKVMLESYVPALLSYTSLLKLLLSFSLENIPPQKAAVKRQF